MPVSHDRPRLLKNVIGRQQAASTLAKRIGDAVVRGLRAVLTQLLVLAGGGDRDPS